MPRKKLYPRPCACGCGQMTRGTVKGSLFVPGHDQKLRIAIENHVGGLIPLRVLIEQQTGRKVEVEV